MSAKSVSRPELLKMKVQELRKLCRRRVSSLRKAELVDFLCPEAASGSAVGSQKRKAPCSGSKPVGAAAAKKRRLARRRYALRARKEGQARSLLDGLLVDGKERELVLGSKTVTVKLEVGGSFLCVSLK